MRVSIIALRSSGAMGKSLILTESQLPEQRNGDKQKLRKDNARKEKT